MHLYVLLNIDASTGSVHDSSYRRYRIGHQAGQTAGLIFLVNVSEERVYLGHQ